MSVAFILILIVLTAAAWYGVRWRAAPDAGLWHAAAFGAAAMTVLAATQGPLYRLAEQRLAVAHVIVLILLIHVAPFFFVRSLTPGVLGRWAAPVATAVARMPLAVPLILLAVTAYGWHMPAAFEAAAASPWLGGAQHLSFVLVGMLAWQPISGHVALRQPLRGLSAFLYMTADEVILGALGIVLTWAPRPLYDVYVTAPRVWGLDVGTDQTLAGALLTVVEEGPMAIALAVVFIRMLQQDEADLVEEERALDSRVAVAPRSRP